MKKVKHKRIKIFVMAVLAVGVYMFSTVEQSQARDRTTARGQGKYFSIYVDKGLDADRIAAKLNYDYFLHPESVVLSDDGVIQESVLAASMDSLYLEVSDILDLHSYNYKGTIKFLRNQKDVSAQFKKYFGKDFTERSFFLREENIIFISVQDLTLGMLGHEIAHAIICHYFVAPPPTKTQEVLAGYVEYSLRKKAGNLPRGIR